MIMAHNLFSKFPLGRSHIHFAHSFHLISPLFQRYCTSYLFFYVLQYFFDLFFQLLPVASKGKKSNIIISKCWGQFICIIIINMVEKYVWLIIHDNSSGRLEIETQGSFFPEGTLSINQLCHQNSSNSQTPFSIWFSILLQ